MSLVNTPRSTRNDHHRTPQSNTARVTSTSTSLLPPISPFQNQQQQHHQNHHQPTTPRQPPPSSSQSPATRAAINSNTKNSITTKRAPSSPSHHQKSHRQITQQQEKPSTEFLERLQTLAVHGISSRELKHQVVYPSTRIPPPLFLYKQNAAQMSLKGGGSTTTTISMLSGGGSGGSQQPTNDQELFESALVSQNHHSNHDGVEGLVDSSYYHNRKRWLPAETPVAFDRMEMRYLAQVFDKLISPGQVADAVVPNDFASKLESGQEVVTERPAESVLRLSQKMEGLLIGMHEVSRLIAPASSDLTALATLGVDKIRDVFHDLLRHMEVYKEEAKREHILRKEMEAVADKHKKDLEDLTKEVDKLSLRMAKHYEPKPEYLENRKNAPKILLPTNQHTIDDLAQKTRREYDTYVPAENKSLQKTFVKSVLNTAVPGIKQIVTGKAGGGGVPLGQSTRRVRRKKSTNPNASSSLFLGSGSVNNNTIKKTKTIKVKKMVPRTVKRTTKRMNEAKGVEEEVEIEVQEEQEIEVDEEVPVDDNDNDLVNDDDEYEYEDEVIMNDEVDDETATTVAIQSAILTSSERACKVPSGVHQYKRRHPPITKDVGCDCSDLYFYGFFDPHDYRRNYQAIYQQVQKEFLEKERKNSAQMAQSQNNANNNNQHLFGSTMINSGTSKSLLFSGSLNPAQSEVGKSQPVPPPVIQSDFSQQQQQQQQQPASPGSNSNINNTSTSSPLIQISSPPNANHQNSNVTLVTKSPERTMSSSSSMMPNLMSTNLNNNNNNNNNNSSSSNNSVPPTKTTSASTLRRVGTGSNLSYNQLNRIDSSLHHEANKSAELMTAKEILEEQQKDALFNFELPAPRLFAHKGALFVQPAVRLFQGAGTISGPTSWILGHEMQQSTLLDQQQQQSGDHQSDNNFSSSPSSLQQNSTMTLINSLANSKSSTAATKAAIQKQKEENEKQTRERLAKVNFTTVGDLSPQALELAGDLKWGGSVNPIIFKKNKENEENVTSSGDFVGSPSMSETSFGAMMNSPPGSSRNLTSKGKHHQRKQQQQNQNQHHNQFEESMMGSGTLPSSASPHHPKSGKSGSSTTRKSGLSSSPHASMRVKHTTSTSTSTTTGSPQHHTKKQNHSSTGRARRGSSSQHHKDNNNDLSPEASMTQVNSNSLSLSLPPPLSPTMTNTPHNTSGPSLRTFSSSLNNKDGDELLPNALLNSSGGGMTNLEASRNSVGSGTVRSPPSSPNRSLIAGQGAGTFRRVGNTVVSLIRKRTNQANTLNAIHVGCQTDPPAEQVSVEVQTLPMKDPFGLKLATGTAGGGGGGRRKTVGASSSMANNNNSSKRKLNSKDSKHNLMEDVNNGRSPARSQTASRGDGDSTPSGNKSFRSKNAKNNNKNNDSSGEELTAEADNVLSSFQEELGVKNSTLNGKTAEELLDATAIVAENVSVTSDAMTNTDVTLANKELWKLSFLESIVTANVRHFDGMLAHRVPDYARVPDDLLEQIENQNYFFGLMSQQDQDRELQIAMKKLAREEAEQDMDDNEKKETATPSKQQPQGETDAQQQLNKTNNDNDDNTQQNLDDEKQQKNKNKNADDLMNNDKPLPKLIVPEAATMVARRRRAESLLEKDAGMMMTTTSNSTGGTAAATADWGAQSFSIGGGGGLGESSFGSSMIGGGASMMFSRSSNELVSPTTSPNRRQQRTMHSNTIVYAKMLPPVWRGELGQRPNFAGARIKQREWTAAVVIECYRSIDLLLICPSRTFAMNVLEFITNKFGDKTRQARPYLLDLLVNAKIMSLSSMRCFAFTQLAELAGFAGIDDIPEIRTSTFLFYFIFTIQRLQRTLSFKGINEFTKGNLVLNREALVALLDAHLCHIAASYTQAADYESERRAYYRTLLSLKNLSADELSVIRYQQQMPCIIEGTKCNDPAVVVQNFAMNITNDTDFWGTSMEGLNTSVPLHADVVLYLICRNHEALIDLVVERAKRIHKQLKEKNVMRSVLASNTEGQPFEANVLPPPQMIAMQLLPVFTPVAVPVHPKIAALEEE